MTKHDKAAAVCSKTVFFEVPNGNVNSIYSAFALLISLLLLCSILTVEGEDAVLSMHRADAARTANYAATPLRSKPVRKWFYQSPLPVHSPLCVTDQNVFFSSSPPIPFGRPGIFDFKYCQFTAIDSNTGELIWTSALESVVSSAPLFAFGKIFAVQRIFEVNNGQLSTRVADIAQFDLRTGTPEIIKTIGSAEHEPLIVSDLMIYVTENRANALELFGNKSKWNSRIGIEVMDIEDTFSASPAYLRSALAVVCASSKGRLFALSIEDGSTLWSTNLSSPPLGTIACSHNRVFCLTRDELVCLSAVGEAVWKKTLGIVEINHLALSESGTLFYVRRDHLYACSAQDGKELFSAPLSGNACAPPTISGDVVYVPSSTAHLEAFDAANGKRLWRYSLFAAANTPAIPFGNSIYISDKRHVVYRLTNMD